MFIRTLLAIFAGMAVFTWIANVVWLAVLALPFSWLWNWTLVPLVHAPVIDYPRAFGVLLIWLILHLVGDIKLSAKLRNSAEP